MKNFYGKSSDAVHDNYDDNDVDNDDLYNYKHGDYDCYEYL
jgi:hypothetical protein